MHWKILCSIAESCMMEVGRQRNHEDPSQRSVSPDTALLAGTDAALGKQENIFIYFTKKKN